MKQEFRIERDSMGDVKVPVDCYWGAQTQRSLENFSIGSERIPKAVVLALALIKKACTEVNFDLGLIDSVKMNLIAKACDEIISGKLDGNFPLSVWQTGSGTQTNMNVNEVIANRANELAGGLRGDKYPVHPNDHVNMSQSSNDVFPTAMNLASVVNLCEVLFPSLENLINELKNLSERWSGTLKIGRTHKMDAVPMSLGQEFSAFQTILQKGFDRLRNSLPSLYELAIGGTAVGTGLNSPAAFGALAAKKIADFTGFPFISSTNKFEALSSHNSISAIMMDLKNLSLGLYKMVNDLGWLASGPNCGLGEINLPANEPGSSIMPGKVNPTQCEALMMVCAQISGYEGAVSFAESQGIFQLNVFKPMMIFDLLNSIQLLSDGMRSFTDKCLKGIKPNEKRMKYYLENSVMLVTALSRKLGYDQASLLAKKAILENLSLKAVCLQSGLLSENEFALLVDPLEMI
ncbi:MAG: class II fumarate hydratase [Candidatus Riflebacteria bacterium]|nr:class II fumarate hydratase [Candidatus Riflebacteria bacterium]